jgi:hypothetical protein
MAVEKEFLRRKVDLERCERVPVFRRPCDQSNAERFSSLLVVVTVVALLTPFEGGF